MTIIHMDTEATRDLAVRFREAAKVFEGSCSIISFKLNQLDWEGESSNDFKSRLKAKVSGLSVFGELILASTQLIDEIERWITADQNAVQTFTDSQTMWQSLLASAGISLTQIPSMFRALIKPYSLNEIWDYLRGTPSGEALEELAREHSTCFVFPDGTIVGDSNAATKYSVNFGETVEGYAGTHDRYDLSITISEDLLREDKVRLAGILGHEMQHAVDASQGKLPMFPMITGTENEAELESAFAKLIASRVHSEVRSYERQENIIDGTMYVDDGVLTGSEIRNFFKQHPDYQTYYESWINKMNLGYTTDIKVSSEGNLVVDLIPVSDLTEFQVN